jgi:hypothetical protein
MPGYPRRRYYFFLALGITLALLLSMESSAEFLIQPSISLSEEYNDNVLLNRSNPQYDVITRLTPSLALAYRTPFWTWDAFSAWEYRHFDKNSRYDGSTQAANVRNQTEFVQNLLYFSAIEDFRRVSTDITTDFTQQSPVVNQVDQNTLTVNPYLIMRPADTVTVALGHTYQDLRYRRGDGISRTDNTDYLETGMRLSSSMSVSLGISDMRERNAINDYEQQETYAGVRYVYAQQSELSGRVGKSRLKYHTGQVLRPTTWRAGFVHRFSMASLALVSSRQYTQDPLNISSRADVQSVEIRNEGARSTFMVSGVQSTYRNITEPEPTAFSRNAQGTFQYRLTSRTHSTVDSSYQHLENRQIGTRTYTSQGSIRISHRLTEAVTLATEYRHLASYSPTENINTYKVNRGIIELRVDF